MGVVFLPQLSQCGDACTDACVVVWKVGSGHAPCCTRRRVDNHPIFPRLHSAGCSGVLVVSCAWCVVGKKTNIRINEKVGVCHGPHYMSSSMALVLGSSTLCGDETAFKKYIYSAAMYLFCCRVIWRHMYLHNLLYYPDITIQAWRQWMAKPENKHAWISNNLQHRFQTGFIS